MNGLVVFGLNGLVAVNRLYLLLLEMVAVNLELRIGSSSLYGMLSLETASCCCLEPASLNCFSPLVCRTSCLPSGAEEACRLSYIPRLRSCNGR